MSDKPTIFKQGRFQLKYRGTECLNCGHPLDISDRYCPNCAQVNSTKKVTIKDFIDEFFSNLIEYDSRLFRTLSSMVLRPGMITKEYISGKRMRYSNPFRFMLSLAIIYFLMLGFSNNYQELDRYAIRNDSTNFEPGLIFNMTFNDEAQDQKQAQQIADSLQTSIGENIKSIRHGRDSLILHKPREYYEKISDSSLLTRLGKKLEYYTTLMSKDSIYGFQEARDKYSVHNTLEDKMAFSMAGSTLRVSRQPGTFINDLISQIPFATFFFLPIFALFILLIYIRKKYTYTDNLIFSFHNQSLLFILLIISFLIDAIFSSSTAWIAVTVFSLYLYKAMRNFYGQGRFKTIIKYLFLNTVYFILAGIAGLIFILASAFTY